VHWLAFAPDSLAACHYIDESEEAANMTRLGYRVEGPFVPESCAAPGAVMDVEKLRGLLAEADAFVPYGEADALKIRIREQLPLDGTGSR
jgi:hypothetical protein